MLNVLIVDNSLAVRNNVKKSLEDLGHNVIAMARDGLEAVDLAKKMKPDLITMDITMPIMTGVEALKEIHMYDKKISIIMVTSYGQESMMMESFKYGALGYILKPTTTKKLSDAIGDVFSQYKIIAKEEDMFHDEHIEHK